MPTEVKHRGKLSHSKHGHGHHDRGHGHRGHGHGHGHHGHGHGHHGHGHGHHGHGHGHHAHVVPAYAQASAGSVKTINAGGNSHKSGYANAKANGDVSTNFTQGNKVIVSNKQSGDSTNGIERYNLSKDVNGCELDLNGIRRKSNYHLGQSNSLEQINSQGINKKGSISGALNYQDGRSGNNYYYANSHQNKGFHAFPFNLGHHGISPFNVVGERGISFKGVEEDGRLFRGDLRRPDLFPRGLTSAKGGDKFVEAAFVDPTLKGRSGDLAVLDQSFNECMKELSSISGIEARKRHLAMFMDFCVPYLPDYSKGTMFSKSGFGALAADQSLTPVISAEKGSPSLKAFMVKMTPSCNPFWFRQWYGGEGMKGQGGAAVIEANMNDLVSEYQQYQDAASRKDLVAPIDVADPNQKSIAEIFPRGLAQSGPMGLNAGSFDSPFSDNFKLYRSGIMLLDLAFDSSNKYLAVSNAAPVTITFQGKNLFSGHMDLDKSYVYRDSGPTSMADMFTLLHDALWGFSHDLGDGSGMSQSDCSALLHLVSDASTPFNTIITCGTGKLWTCGDSVADWRWCSAQNWGSFMAAISKGDYESLKLWADTKGWSSNGWSYSICGVESATTIFAGVGGAEGSGVSIVGAAAGASSETMAISVFGWNLFSFQCVESDSVASLLPARGSALKVPSIVSLRKEVAGAAAPALWSLKAATCDGRFNPAVDFLNWGGKHLFSMASCVQVPPEQVISGKEDAANADASFVAASGSVAGIYAFMGSKWLPLPMLWSGYCLSGVELEIDAAKD